MDRLTKGRLNKERELELKLAMLQINYESEIIANKLEFERRLMHMNKITKITFKQQVFIGIILIIAGNVLALILHKGLFANIAWILYGLILILNPVYPEKYSNDEKRAKLGSRIAGIICILTGILTGYIP